LSGSTAWNPLRAHSSIQAFTTVASSARLASVDVSRTASFQSLSKTRLPSLPRSNRPNATTATTTTTLPQAKINASRRQVPPRRDVRVLIAAKTKSLLADCDGAVRARLIRSAERADLMTGAARSTPGLAGASVSLVVTSPPFLDVVNYAADNWLRCWFCGIDVASVQMSMHKKVDEWQAAMTEVFYELARVLKDAGHIAFEVGEVRGGTIKLEEAVLPCGVAAGLEPQMIVINSQAFTKTANCWGVKNNAKGTNTNRIVVFRK